MVTEHRAAVAWGIKSSDTDLYSKLIKVISRVAVGQLHSKQPNQMCHQKTRFAIDGKLVVRTADEALCMVHRQSCK